MERVRLKKRFRYTGHPETIRRKALEAERSRVRRRELAGSRAVLSLFREIMEAQQAERLGWDRLQAFLESRPQLKKEVEAFQAAGGGSLDELRRWLGKAESRPEPITVKKHLALVWSSEAPAQPAIAARGA